MRGRAVIAACVVPVLLCLSSAAQSQAPRSGASERSEAERERRREERERRWERQQEIREADEERARALHKGGSYSRQREAEEKERAARRETERREVDARNRALREAYRRDEEQSRRALRELEERERRARETSARQEAPASRSEKSPPLRASRAATVSCAARPYCPRADGYGNACKEVSASVSGRPQIVQLCQQANTPEPCGAGLPGDSGARNRYMASFGGGCTHQCAAAAECSLRAKQ